MESDLGEKVILDGLAIQTYQDKNYLPSSQDSTQPQISPYKSQLDVDELYSNSDSFVAFNTAPTGAGKTFSWLTPTVKYELDALVIYPTKSLASDQKNAAQIFISTYFPGKSTHVEQIDADTMNTLREKHPSSTVTNSTIIKDRISMLKDKHSNLIVLTNPDVFTLLRHNKYGNYAKRMSEIFDTIVVDEFHRSNTKGKYSLPFLFDDLYRRSQESTPTSKFLFLSATPDSELQSRLETGMSVPYQDLKSKDSRKPLSKADLDSNWRAIMPEINLRMIAGTIFNTGDELLSDEHVRDFVEFCQKGRTVIILDSLREVSQVHQFLSQQLEDREVCRIDGFNSQNINKKLKQFDVLVGNSAVEVGVDFDVDQAIISGYTSSSLLQRIGRVRNQAGRKNVVLFTSRRFLSAMSRLSNLYPDSNPIPRSEFRDVVTDTLSDGEEPDIFGRLYGSVEAFKYVKSETDDQLPENSSEYYKESFQMIRDHFYRPQGVDVTANEVDRMARVANSPIGECLLSYRNSELTAVYYDTQKNTLGTYGIPQLLRYGKVEFVTKDQLSKILNKEQKSKLNQMSSYADGYAVYRGRIDTGPDKLNQRTVKFNATRKIKQCLSDPIDERVPVESGGIQLIVNSEDSAPVSGIEKLNSQLTEKSKVCFPIEGSPRSVSHHFSLGPYFQLSELGNVEGDYSISFGINSLYLHSHVVEHSNNENLAE